MPPATLGLTPVLVEAAPGPPRDTKPVEGEGEALAAPAHCAAEEGAPLPLAVTSTRLALVSCVRRVYCAKRATKGGREASRAPLVAAEESREEMR
jgi:hypothetical protein